MKMKTMIIDPYRLLSTCIGHERARIGYLLERMAVGKDKIPIREADEAIEYVLNTHDWHVDYGVIDTEVYKTLPMFFNAILKKLKINLPKKLTKKIDYRFHDRLVSKVILPARFYRTHDVDELYEKVIERVEGKKESEREIQTMYM